MAGLSLSLTLATTALSQETAKSAAPAAPAAGAQEVGKFEDRLSYLLGHDYASGFKETKVELNLEQFKKGLEDALAGKPSALSEEVTEKTFNEFEQILAKLRQEMQEKQEKEMSELAGKNAEAAKAFLETNAKKEGVKTTASGLQYEWITEGKGNKPKPSDIVSVHYVGTLLDGTEFDSSIARGQPAQFPVEGVIPGWTEALQLMGEGSKVKLYIKPELAYGERSPSPTIPPNSLLIFEVELLKVGQ